MIGDAAKYQSINRIPQLEFAGRIVFALQKQVLPGAAGATEVAFFCAAFSDGKKPQLRFSG